MNRNLIASSALAASVIVIMSCLLTKRRNKRTRIWSRNWLQRRNEGRDVLNMLNTELLPEDPNAYTNFLRLTNDQFEYLLSLISNEICKQDTLMRECIPSRSKLEVTLRFLATGETYRSLMYTTRIHETTISRFIPEVCQAIVLKLKPIYLKAPRTAEEWKKISQDFDQLWQFPHCVGALDGRHITFRAPISAGSYYYNYKGANSIVLLALAAANYKFIYANIGVNGRISDGGVFQNSSLSRALQDNSLSLPAPEVLPGMTEALPYVIVADDAFPLSKNLLKPYPDRGLGNDSRIFNYRLSRARRIIENSFGILANRFRLLLNPVNLDAEKVELITLTCVVLHNFLATDNAQSYIELEEFNENLPKINRQCGNRTSIAVRCPGNKMQ
ncbi:protein ALP1-like [Photinus pyralis]|uniref:protein ALP1-like n=2 Tax=Photinus pyralis TaxID=7054 RepID=UPI001266E722|nr:protein ALP1-like [Photinus pyralis]